MLSRIILFSTASLCSGILGAQGVYADCTTSYNTALTAITNYDQSTLQLNVVNTSIDLTKAVNAVTQLQSCNNIPAGDGNGLWDDALNVLTTTVSRDLSKTYNVHPPLTPPVGADSNFSTTVGFNESRIFVSDPTVQTIYEYDLNTTTMQWNLSKYQISPLVLNPADIFGKVFDVKGNFLVAVDQTYDNHTKLDVFAKSNTGGWTQIDSLDLAQYDKKITDIHVAMSLNDYSLFSFVAGISGSKGVQYVIYDLDSKINTKTSMETITFNVQKPVVVKGSIISVAASGDYMIIGRNDAAVILKAKSVINKTSTSVSWSVEKTISNHIGYINELSLSAAGVGWKTAVTYWVNKNHWAKKISATDLTELSLTFSPKSVSLESAESKIASMIAVAQNANPQATINSTLLENILFSAYLGAPEYGNDFGQAVSVYEEPVLQISSSGIPTSFGNVSFAVGSPGTSPLSLIIKSLPSAVYTIVKSNVNNQKTPTWSQSTLNAIPIMGDSLYAGYSLAMGDGKLLVAAKTTQASVSSMAMVYGFNNDNNQGQWLFTYNTPYDTSFGTGEIIKADTPVAIGVSDHSNNSPTVSQTVVISGLTG